MVMERKPGHGYLMEIGFGYGDPSDDPCFSPCAV